MRQAPVCTIEIQNERLLKMTRRHNQRRATIVKVCGPDAQWNTETQRKIRVSTLEGEKKAPKNGSTTAERF